MCSCDIRSFCNRLFYQSFEINSGGVRVLVFDLGVLELKTVFGWCVFVLGILSHKGVFGLRIFY